MRAPVALVAALVVCGPLACSGDVTGTGGHPEVPDITYIVMARITAGTSHSCAISGLGSGLPLGSGFCWGLNDYDQLGDAGSDGRPNGEASEVALEPVPISGNLLFLRLQAGGVFTCGIHPVELLVYCWGGGIVGGDTRTPRPVTDQLRFRELSAGESHICAEMYNTQAVYCWGENDFGQLGDGSTSRSSSPVPVAGLTVKSLSSGVAHTCAVLVSGEGLCWGDATSGKLGDGSTGGIQSTPVSVAGNLDLAGIGTGRDHSCAITVAGAAYCWGSNEFGQLGSAGAGASSATPVAVDGGLVFRAISAGWYYTCAITNENAGYCWGANESGQLGNRLIQQSVPSPDSVETDISFQTLQGGRHHTCATAGDLGFCWGGNEFGQVGNGTRMTTPTVGRVMGKPVRAPGS